MCPRISREFLAEEERVLGPWWYRQEYHCQCSETIDQVFAHDVVMGALASDVVPLFAPAAEPPRTPPRIAPVDARRTVLYKARLDRSLAMKIRPALALALLVAGSLGAGCAGNTAAARDAQVRANLTPELKTLSQRPIDVDNRTTLTFDENSRMANEDLQRFWLIDRPSRLARPRIPR